MPLRHPDHDAIRRTIHGWYHEPYSGMGYSNEVFPWGVVWKFGHAHLTPFDPDDLDAILRELHSRYGGAAFNLNMEDLGFADRLGPQLAAAGFRRLPDELFLASTSEAKFAPPESDVEIEAVTRHNIREFARARLEAFAEDVVSEEETDREVETRSAEMDGTGRGLIATIEGQPCGGIWWYEEEEDGWVLYLGTHRMYRRRGVATRLIAECAGVKKRRSLLINVVEDNAPARNLYEKVGFHDEVYRKHRFRFEPKE